MLLLRLFGLFLLRLAARALLSLLSNDPPRTTRWGRVRPHRRQRTTGDGTGILPRRRLLPTTQQSADLGHHQRNVLVLPLVEPSEPGSEAKVHAQLRQRFIGERKTGEALLLVQVGFLETFSQVEGRIRQATRHRVTIRSREMIGGGQQPAQQVEGSGKDGHLGMSHDTVCPIRRLIRDQRFQRSEIQERKQDTTTRNPKSLLRSLGLPQPRRAARALPPA